MAGSGLSHPERHMPRTKRPIGGLLLLMAPLLQEHFSTIFVYYKGWSAKARPITNTYTCQGLPAIPFEVQLIHPQNRRTIPSSSQAGNDPVLSHNTPYAFAKQRNVPHLSPPVLILLVASSLPPHCATFQSLNRVVVSKTHAQPTRPKLCQFFPQTPQNSPMPFGPKITAKKTG